MLHHSFGKERVSKKPPRKLQNLRGGSMQCAFPAAGGAHFQRHVNGTNSSSSGKISRRPSSMQIMSTILLSGEKMEKLPVGPTRESPGPTLDRHESAR